MAKVEKARKPRKKMKEEDRRNYPFQCYFTAAEFQEVLAFKKASNYVGADGAFTRQIILGAARESGGSEV